MTAATTAPDVVPQAHSGQGGAAPSAPASAAPSAPAKPKRRAGVFLIVSLLVAAATGGYWWTQRFAESTDNAQVDGEVVAVPARTGGTVAQVLFTENQQVKAGETLAVLDDESAKARLAQAEANVEAAEAAADAAEADARVAEIHALGNKSVAEAAVRSPESALKQAENERNRNQKRMAQARAKAARAQVGIARAGCDLAKLELSYTRIVAPTDGVASKKSIAVGQQVAAGQAVAQLVTPVVWVTANFKETQIAKMHPGQPAHMEVDALPGVTLHGELESVSGATGARFTLLPPDNASGNFTKVVQRVPVRVKVHDLPQGVVLRPGMSVALTIDTHG